MKKGKCLRWFKRERSSGVLKGMKALNVSILNRKCRQLATRGVKYNGDRIEEPNSVKKVFSYDFYFVKFISLMGATSKP